MEELFNWVMLGWLLNICFCILLFIVLCVKVFTRDDVEIFKINVEIWAKRVNNLSAWQKVLQMLIPFYGAVMSIVFLGYFIKNYNRDTIIVLIEIDYILEDYRIWKRNGLAN